MRSITFTTGISLVILGIGAYLITGFESITALIPAFFGILFIAGGYLAKSEKARKHTMHGLLLLAIIGIIPSFSGINKLISYAGGETIENAEAAVAKSIMVLILLMFLIFGIKSFVDARKK